MRRGCADSIRARDTTSVSSQGRIYGSNILFVTNELYLASRGDAFMTHFLFGKSKAKGSGLELRVIITIQDPTLFFLKRYNLVAI